MVVRLSHRNRNSLLRRALALCCGLAVAAAGLPPAGAQNDGSLLPLDRDGVSHLKVVVPMVFPVLGECYWSDTFLASRGGGRRRHHGQDLMGPKMRPLLAVFEGTVHISASSAAKGHNLLYLRGRNGWTAAYMHINNDTPGTDDGQGTPRYAYARGIRNGARVRAGQMVAWLGDSGNSEYTAPHLHFELYHPSGAVINPAPSLRCATRIADPSAPLPEETPEETDELLPPAMATDVPEDDGDEAPGEEGGPALPTPAVQGDGILPAPAVEGGSASAAPAVQEGAGSAIPGAPAPAEDAVPLAPEKGEILLRGVVRLVDPAGRKVAIASDVFTLPGGEPQSLASPRSRLILFDTETHYRFAGKGAAPAAFDDVRPGARVWVVGRHLGVGEPLPARALCIEPAGGRGV